jgi:cytochrome c oxidase cbb3-type subunit 3
MCSRFRDQCALVLLLLATVCACDREKREFAAPAPSPSPAFAGLQPGDRLALASSPAGARYENNAYHIGQGQNLFRWMNCTGCHANGGGDIGPALMDDEWRYGGDIDHIFASIDQGRPNGMPAFRGKIPPEQIWELAAYVRSLAGNVRKDAVPSRAEGMSAIPPLTREKPKPPRAADPASEQEPQR